MRKRLLLAAVSAMLAGCGYVGDPLPPALNIPRKITDLRVIQRGERVVLDFTAPVLTTEELPVKVFSTVEARIGPLPPQFTVDNWAAGAKPIPVTPTEPGDAVHVEAHAAEWRGREVMVAVRTGGPKGRVSEWSNGIVLTIRDPLPKPVLRVEPDPRGVRVTWTPPVARAEVRVLRQAQGEPAAALIGTASGAEYVDTAAVFGKPYTYTGQFVAGTAESDLAEPVSVVPADVFAPATPAGLTAVAGLNSVELAWERNTEPDLRAYRVYRASGTGEFEQIADGVEGPAYSDRQVQSGTAYRYQVSAVDATGNESARSQTLEVTAP